MVRMGTVLRATLPMAVCRRSPNGDGYAAATQRTFAYPSIAPDKGAKRRRSHTARPSRPSTSRNRPKRDKTHWLYITVVVAVVRGVIVGIDRFISEARALTNCSGNAVATVLVGHWTNTVDQREIQQVLHGDKPFDESTMLDDEEPEEASTRRWYMPTPCAPLASPGTGREQSTRRWFAGRGQATAGSPCTRRPEPSERSGPVRDSC